MLWVNLFRNQLPAAQVLATHDTTGAGELTAPLGPPDILFHDTPVASTTGDFGKVNSQLPAPISGPEGKHVILPPGSQACPLRPEMLRRQGRPFPLSEWQQSGVQE